MKRFVATIGAITFFVCSFPLLALAADVTPPGTSLYPYSSSADQTYPSSITVSLSCYDYGSGCAATYYCLGKECQPTTPYQGNKVRILESTVLRYYSADNAANAEEIKTQNYTILFPDKVPPVVAKFVVPDYYRSLTFPVSVSASDNVAVSAYCVTESSDPAACTWDSTAPVNFTVTGSGAHTLNAFARDAAGNVSAPATAIASDPKNFVAAPQAVDFVYGTARDTLYITSGATILRYQVASRSFLPPYQTGGTLTGIDLSPDGNTLAAADESRSSIFLVDLGKNTVVEKAFIPVAGETGIHSVAFAADGTLLVASQGSAGSSTPLRRYDPTTGEIRTVANLVGATLAPGPDSRCFAFLENGSGSLGIYDAVTQKITLQLNSHGNSRQVGVDRGCSQVAHSGIFHSSEVAIDAYIPSATGVAYHPGADLVYLASGSNGTVLAYDNKTFSMAAAYDAGGYFGTGGYLKVARDGSYLFALVDLGIGIIDLTVPVAQSQSLTLNKGTAAALKLSAVTPEQAALSYRVTALPRHGTLSGTPPNLTYSPAPSFEGSDSISFSASNVRGESGVGTINLTVARDAIAPVISSFSMPATSTALVVPISGFSATDRVGIAGYCVTEASSSGACSWSATPAASYDFTGYQPYRPHTVYAFARDAAGNVSQAASATVAIAIPGSAPAPPLLTLPSLSEGLTLWGSLTASPGIGMQYCLTESPDASKCSWSSYPSPYSFTSYGTHTIYAFALSASGNISAPASGTVTIIGKRGDLIPGSYEQVAYEPTRQIVYLMQTGKILRYHLPTQSFLPPYLEGKNLGGIDTSPDGKTLVAGNAAGVGIYLVDLASDAVTEVQFSAAPGEPATTQVAFGSDGAVVARGAASSGSSPLHRYDPVSGAASVVATVPTGWYPGFSPSPGGQCIALYDGNGHVSVYDAAMQSVAYSADLFDTVHPNSDCSEFASVYSNPYRGSSSFVNIYNGSLAWKGSLSEAALGLAYAPQQEVLYLLSASNVLKAYHSTSLGELARYPMQGSTTAPGQHQSNVPLVVSRDGSLVFGLFLDGVGYARVTGAVAENQLLAITRGQSAAVTLTGRSSGTAGLSYRIVTAPAHGTLTGTAPRLVYTPDAGFLGRDAIDFTVNDGSAESETGTVTIAVSAAQGPAPSVYLTIPWQATGREIPVTLDISQYSAAVAPFSWCLTESASAASCAWSPSRPQSYSFGGDLPQATPVTRSLYAFVMDGSGNLSAPSSPASVVITMPDTTPPAVIGFNLPTSYPGLTVPVGLVGGDNGKVSTYCLTKINNSSSCSWQWYNSNQMFNVNVGNYGMSTFYAFARDSAGNVSPGASATVMAVREPAFTITPDPYFDSCENYSYTIAADGYPAPVLSLAGGLPAGLSFTPDSDGTATLSGTPHGAAVGQYPVTVQADIGMGYLTSRQLTVTVAQGSRLQLAVTMAGSGTGSVNSSPAGLTCTGGTCLWCYDKGEVVDLFSAPSAGSLFTSWGGTCSGAGNCQVTMTGDNNLIASFTQSSLVKLASTVPAYFGTLQSACINAPAGATLFAQAVTFVENVTVDGSINLKGGFDAGFAPTSSPTVLSGALAIRSGRLTVDRLVIR